MEDAILPVASFFSSTNFFRGTSTSTVWHARLEACGGLNGTEGDFGRLRSLGERNSLGGGFKYFLFSPLPGEMVKFD